jgi:hypothetical protein
MPLEVVIDKLTPGWQVEQLLDELETRSGLGSDAVEGSRRYYLPVDGDRPDRGGVEVLEALLDRISPSWKSYLRLSSVQAWMPFLAEHFLELPSDPDAPEDRRFAVRLSQKRIGCACVRVSGATTDVVDLEWVADKVNDAVTAFGHSGVVERLLAPSGLRLWADPR